MRFIELMLTSFGPFTDRRLIFDASKPLTVVYGPNEAGKSSALAAMIDVLFGIEQRSRYNFVHKHAAMRVGATLADRSGKTVRFGRRKGAKKTLLDELDRPLADDALLTFLGTADRDLFVEAFGLDQARLRTGARRLIEDHGEIGQGLLAAAPGMAELSRVRRQLEGDAEALFTVRKVASKPFYNVLLRCETARKQIRDSLLQVEHVRDAERAYQAAVQNLQSRELERNQLRRDKTRNMRHLSLLPLLRRIAALTRELETLGPLPELPADFDADREAAAAAQATATHERASAETSERELSDSLSALHLSQAVLDRGEEIEQWSQARPSIEKAANDLQRRVGEIELHRSNLREIARRLGLRDADAILKGRPTVLATAKVRDLIERSVALASTRHAVQQQHDAASAALTKLVREQGELGLFADTRTLHRKLADIAVGVASVSDLSELEGEVTRSDRFVSEAIARLSIPVASAETLAEMAAPDPTTIERLDLEMRKASDAIDRIVLNREKATRDLDGAQQRLRELAAAGEVPTVNAIDSARTERARVWRKVRSAISEAQPLDRAAGTSLAERHEEVTAHVDHLVDRRAGEAERVGQHASAVASREKAAALVAQLDEELETARTDVTRTTKAWQEAWQRAGIQALSPREMLAFLESRHEVLRYRETLVTSRAKLRRLALQETTSRAELAEVAKELNVEVVTHESLESLLRKLRDVVDDHTTRRNAASSLRKRIEDQEHTLAKTLLALEQTAQSLDHWEQEWREAIVLLGLPNTAGIPEAKAALDSWSEVPGIAKSLADLEHRVLRIRADHTEFSEAVEALVGEVAPDLIGESSFRSACELRKRHEDARAIRQQQTNLEKQIRGARTHKASACAKQHASELAIADLLRVAEVTSMEPLRDLIRKVRHRDALRGQAASERAELAKDAAGLDEQALRHEIGGADPDELKAHALALDEQETLLDTQIGEAQTNVNQTRNALAVVESRDGAELASQEAQSALAELASIAEEWTLLRTASRLLAAAIEEYRTSHESPVLSRAKAIFRDLTTGRFAGLEVELDEDDRSRLVAVRIGGDRVAIEGLSEGTADQLFMALRIATIEEHASRTEPLPLVCDDLFVSFDDARTIAGLRVLADLGAKTQTIVFTHHARLVELARESLGERVQVIDLAAA